MTSPMLERLEKEALRKERREDISDIIGIAIVTALVGVIVILMFAW